MSRIERIEDFVELPKGTTLWRLVPGGGLVRIQAPLVLVAILPHQYDEDDLSVKLRFEDDDEEWVESALVLIGEGIFLSKKSVARHAENIKQRKIQP